MTPAYLRAGPQGVLLRVKVQPRAARNEVGEVLGEELKLRIAAPPVDDAANQVLIEYLAEVLECPRHAVHLVRGRTSRHKTLLVQGTGPELVAAKLGPLAKLMASR